MTDEEAQEIAARAAAATPGPWEQPAYPSGTMVYRLAEREHIADCERATDADFIAHARADIPALLAERAALLAEVEQWRAIGRRYVGYGVVEQTVTDSTGAPLTYQQCEWCLKQARIGDPFTHAPDCLAEQSRILLGMQEVTP